MLERTPEQRTQGAARSAWIDVMRGWAVLSVVLLHLNIRIPFADSELGKALPREVIRLLFSSGYHGVIVFFVISGFLITTGIERRWGALAQVDVAKFYRIRFARIAPCLLLFVAVQASLQFLRVPGFVNEKHATSIARAIVSALTFHLNWLEAQVGYLPGAWDVLWSLCIEELFYLGYPLAIIVFRSRTLLTCALVLLVALGPWARTHFSNNPIWSDHGYLSCMGEIALGCLAAMFGARLAKRPLHAWGALTLGLAAMLLILYFRRTAAIWRLPHLGVDVTVLAIGTALVLTALRANAAWESKARSAILQPFRWFGHNSYEIYLAHMFVVIPVTLSFKAAGSSARLIPAAYAITIVLTALLGLLLARLFSEPLNRWIRDDRALPKRIDT